MARADAAAKTLLEKFSLGKPPIDPYWLAEQLGVTIVPQQLAPDVSGMLLRNDGQQVIGVNQTHTKNRQKFTVAHELGHLLLHRGRPLILDTDLRINYRDAVSGMATDREEIEANRFAAALLAPEEMVRASAAASPALSADELVDTLAHEFKVSMQSMSFRLMNLGIISGAGH
jgi:Zn-dependent peptidase ImmA (M78 family)